MQHFKYPYNCINLLGYLSPEGESFPLPFSMSMFKKFFTANFLSKINMHPVNMSDPIRKKVWKFCNDFRLQGKVRFKKLPCFLNCLKTFRIAPAWHRYLLNEGMMKNPLNFMTKLRIVIWMSTTPIYHSVCKEQKGTQCKRQLKDQAPNSYEEKDPEYSSFHLKGEATLLFYLQQGLICSWKVPHPNEYSTLQEELVSLLTPPFKDQVTMNYNLS